jgi:TnsA endonuclease N terminal
MRARKITNKGIRKVIGKFPSMKLKKTIWWESQLERDYIYLLEFDPDVISYQEQPFTILYNASNKSRHYTPDFLVERVDKSQVIEIKPEAHKTKEKNIFLFKSVAPIFTEEGYEFLVVTDTMIRVQPRLSNIKLLIKYARTPITPQHQIHCYEMLNGRQEVSLGELVESFGAKTAGIQMIYSLLFWGVLATDLMKSISVDSTVRFNKFLLKKEY